MIKHAIDLNKFQANLFPLNRDEFLKQVNTEIGQLKKWYEHNFLSFNPEEVKEFYDKELIEAIFIKGLFNSGLSFERISFMLGKLDKPYVYSFDQIFWHFAKEEWISIEDIIKDYIEENYSDICEQYCEHDLDEIIERMKDDGNYQEADIYEYGNYVIIKRK